MTVDDSQGPAPGPLEGDASDEAAVDRALGAALDELIDAVQETKQAVWLTSDPEQHRALEALQSFLVEQAGEVAAAEARIDGRSPFVVSPSGRHPPNLAARAGGDRSAMLGLLVGDLETLEADVRRLAGRIAGRKEGQLLERLAEGLEEHLGPLRG